MTSPRIIVGAGLAGLIAAHAWPQAPIVEAAPAPAQAHQALLRFRSDAVARLTGTDFRKVRVHKGIWYRGAYVVPSILMANLYAGKCLGRLIGERSIWNLDAVERFIAPPDFYAQLLANVGARIQWATPMNWNECKFDCGPVVSTAPLPEVLATLKPNAVDLDGFHRAPIHVRRFQITDADVYQTVYFPDDLTQLYRASITGNVLICEFAEGPPESGDEWEQMVVAAFGMEGLVGWTETTRTTQRYGKIAPIDDAVRRELLFQLTHRWNIYSLGRFSTWRNILLCDLINDIDYIKKLLRADTYGKRLDGV